MTRRTLPDAVDVVIAGSGAAGLTAALAAADRGASVLLVEAAAQVGGTSALSGGRIWVPLNGHAANRDDTAEAAGAYLRALVPDQHHRFVDTFLETAPRMIEFLERHSAHRFTACASYPDYHPALPGATTGGRCLDPGLLELSPMAERLVAHPPGYAPVTHDDWERWRFPANYDRELLARRQARGIRAGGVALVAGLLDAVLDRGVRVETSTRLIGVSHAEGAVSAVDLAVDGAEAEVRTSAVILATGGFDRDDELCARHLPAAVRASGAPPTNRGDALRIAEHLGAELANLSEGWWMPMIRIPGDEFAGEPYPKSLVRERGTPHQIIVNRAGRRFVDEAAPYNELGKAFLAVNDDGSHPNADAFIVFDEEFRTKYTLPGLSPEGDVPEWVASAGELTALADRIGVDPDGLRATVARWNHLCELGRDEDFGRGQNAYDRYYGDPSVRPAPNLGPIGRAPYYAVQVLAGTIGSKGGPVTDTDGRLLRTDGSVIDGVFAVGNASAFWTGEAYPGPGATLAVGMTMGYRAGRAVGERPSSE